MKQLAFERAVEGRLLGRPHFLPVFDNATKIPQRLREINPSYYVVLNVVRVLEKAQGLHFREWTRIPPGVTPRYNAWYEVHKLTAPNWLNAGVIIPFGTLDARCLRYVWERDTEFHGDTIVKRLLQANENLEASKVRDRRNRIEAMTRDIPWGKSFFGPDGPGKVGDLQGAKDPPARIYVPV